MPARWFVDYNSQVTWYTYKI